MLKEIAPNIKRAAVIRDPEQVSGGGQIGAIQSVAAMMQVDLHPIGLRDVDEIERAVAAFASRPNGGLIVTTAAWAQIHRDELVALAARHRLPAVYPYRLFIRTGGLVCYTPDIVHQYEQAAGYVNRILKGERPGDLPVQAPTKYELVINLKTAKALGLDSPIDAAGPRRRGDRMSNRREFITLLGGAAAAWPLSARGQQFDRMWRIGVLVTEPWPEVEGLHDGLLELGYREGENLLIEYRFAQGDAGRFPDWPPNLSEFRSMSSCRGVRQLHWLRLRRPVPSRSLCRPAIPSVPASLPASPTLEAT